MGNGCCGREYSDDKVESASTISELFNVINERAKETQKEIRDIERYLSNPNSKSDLAVLFYK